MTDLLTQGSCSDISRWILSRFLLVLNSGRGLCRQWDGSVADCMSGDIDTVDSVTGFAER